MQPTDGHPYPSYSMNPQHQYHYPPPHLPLPYPSPLNTMVYPPPPTSRPREEHDGSYHHAQSQHEHGRGIKRARPNGQRHPSDEEEEAGLALAGLGLGLSPDQVRQRRDSLLESPPLQEVTGKGKEAAKGKKASKPGKGAKSCSECRRLKAKCDRVFPCSNCRRRGCALVCPDGDLSCMQGKRLVLASTEQLHDRITQLETALSQAHGKTAPTVHPLLAAEYLDGGFASLSPRHTVPSLLPPSSGSPDTQSTSLHIATPNTSGLIEPRSSSHPRMAVESLLLSEDVAVPEERKDAQWVGENAAPAMIIGTAMPVDKEAKRKVIEKLQELHRVLPPRQETKRRAARFFDGCKWFTNILRQPEFENVYEPAVYEPTSANPLSPHKLASVLMVLTLETFLDVTGDEDDPAIARYWEAAQQCFDTRFGWAASVPGIQALALATYFVTFGWSGARASNFFWLRQTTSAILQLGLHKDPHPSLPQSEQDLRRRVFWEAFTMDALLSINHGQRPAIYVETVETLEPSDASEIQKVKYQYMRQVKLNVLDIGCRPDSAPASAEHLRSTLETLKRWEPAAIPHLHCPVLTGTPMPEPSTDLTRINMMEIHLSMSSMCHYKAMMFLLRPSLRRLLARLRSQPGTLDDLDREVINMTYGACRAITQLSKYMTRTHPRLSARLWSTWVQTFSAAVSMAALAIWCGTQMGPEFVASAYQELCEACDMIRENRSARSRNVESLLPILQSLVADRHPHVVGRPAPGYVQNQNQNQQEKEDMLFALLGGRVDTPTPTTLAGSGTHAHAEAQAIHDQNAHAHFWKPHLDTGPENPQDHNPELSAMDLWNQLQSFYEPTPDIWTQTQGQGPVSMPMPFMDGMVGGVF